MDFITVREFRTDPGKVWEKLEAEKELVITKNGKPFAVLTATKPTTLDDDLRTLKRARAMGAADAMRKHAEHLGLDKMTQGEVNAEIAAARRGLRKKPRAAGR